VTTLKKETPPSTGPLSQKDVLLQALNAAAASLQRAAHAEADVFRTFTEQITRIGLQGGVSLLDEDGTHLVTRAAAYPGSVLTNLEKLVGLKVDGYTFALDRVDVFRQVVQTGQAVYLPDIRAVLLELLPGKARPFADRIIKALGTPPSIFAPLLSLDQVQGVLNIAGPHLTPRDIPAVEAFANHIAIALENARAYAELRQTEARFL